jgi:hypothetical protein
MKKTYSYDKDVTGFFLLLAFVFGAAVRIFPLARVDFPLVDGGMFYAMIKDLQASNYILPEFTSYNHANIPFAYPPLGFYIAGLLNSLSGISLLNILHWLPVTLTLLNIPLFYLFSKQVVGSTPKAALATLVFTLTPNSYWWNIVGGGLTRALGTLLFTATALSFYQMYRLRTRMWITLSIASAAGAILSHPAWALQSIVAVIVLWYFFGRDKQGILYSGITALGVLLLTSPWWLTVIQQHGVETFFNATQGTYSRLRFWTVFFTLSFTDEYTPVIAVFGLCGLFIHLARKEYFLPAWVVICLFVEPRGGIPVSVFPFSIMAMTVLTDGISSRFISPTSAVEEWVESLKLNSGKLFFGFFILLFVYNAFQVSNTLAHQVLSAEERAAINWVKSNTKPADRFLILDQQPNPLHSPLTEWFPALAERRSITTIQGTEWLGGEMNYVNNYDAIVDVSKCLYQNVECIYKIQLADNYDYIMLSVIGGTSPLGDSLNASGDFTLAYSSESIRIFRTEK